MSKKPFNYDILKYIFILRKQWTLKAYLNKDQENERKCQQESVIC